MESPGSGVDSYSDADSHQSNTSRSRAKKRKANHLDRTIEGQLIKWWSEIRGSDRQPWQTPVPTSLTANVPHRQTAKVPGQQAPKPSTSLLQKNSGAPPRNSKPGKRKVTLVSPPASRSCGPFMCHGLHNSYLIDEKNASAKESASAARLAAERKKATAPKPFLVGGRGPAALSGSGGGCCGTGSGVGVGGAGGVSGSGANSVSKRTVPWRVNRLRSVKELFPFQLDTTEEEARKNYREAQLNSAPRLSALQHRKIRHHISARSGTISCPDPLKVGDCLRVLNKLADANEENTLPDDDPGLTGALIILSSDQPSTQTDFESNTTQSPKCASHIQQKEYKRVKSVALGPKWANFLGLKESSTKPAPKASFQSSAKTQTPGTFPLTGTSPCVRTTPFVSRRETERKVTRQKSRTTVKLSSRTSLLKKTPLVTRKKFPIEGYKHHERVPVSLCVQVKSCVEGTGTDELNMFGTPAAAHARGLPADSGNKGTHVQGPRRRSESQLVSAAASEAAKWLANRSGTRRQAAGLPVVQLLLPGATDVHAPSGDARVGPAVQRRPTKVTATTAPPQPSLQIPSSGPVPALTWQRSVADRCAKTSKKRPPAPRRTAVQTQEPSSATALRRCFGAPPSRLTMDEIGSEFGMDWSEVLKSSPGYLRSPMDPTRPSGMRGGLGDYKIADMDAYSVASNDYLELLSQPEPNHNPNIPSKLRMLGGMPKQFFGRNERDSLDDEATLMRMGFIPKQKACMETQVTPRVNDRATPLGSKRVRGIPMRALQNSSTGDAANEKRTVEVSASVGSSTDSVIPLAFRRDGSNQAFKAVLDMVLQEAEGRGGGGGGDNRTGSLFGSDEGGGDLSMFRTFFTHALKPQEVNPGPSIPNFSFDTPREFAQHSSYKATSNNVTGVRKQHPKSAEEKIKSLLGPRYVGPPGSMSEKRTLKDSIPGCVADRMNLDAAIILTPRTNGNRNVNCMSEVKSSPRMTKIAGTAMDVPGVIHHPQDIPAQLAPSIARSRTITSASLGELVSTLRRAEKLS